MTTLNKAYVNLKETNTEDAKEVFGKKLMQYCHAVVKKHYRANELDRTDEVSDAVVKVLEEMPSYQPERSSFATWASVVIRNMCRDAAKTRVRHSEMILLEDDLVSNGGMEDVSNRILLDQLVSKLDKSDQVIVKLHLEGFTEAEIGEKIGTSRDVIAKAWQRRIMPKLKELTQPAG
jgi:RNA polymerase sigma factor (sigma-70 family)